jgi:hypothetical protein
VKQRVTVGDIINECLPRFDSDAHMIDAINHGLPADLRLSRQTFQQWKSGKWRPDRYRVLASIGASKNSFQQLFWARIAGVLEVSLDPIETKSKEAIGQQ